jgi:hypothetical protein
MGSYDVTLTVVNSFGEDTKTVPDYINVGYTGIDDGIISEDDVAVYPNPSTGLVNVSFKGDVQSIVAVSAYNTIGEIVFEMDKQDGINKLLQIDFSEYQPGVYYLNVKTDDGVILKKVTLTR